MLVLVLYATGGKNCAVLSSIAYVNRKGISYGISVTFVTGDDIEYFMKKINTVIKKRL